MMQMDFRSPAASDAEAITEIDRAGLLTGHASFRSDPYRWEAFEAAYLGDRGFSILAVTDERVAAWAGVVTVSDRCVYAGVGEVSVYVSPACRGLGVGGSILRHLADQSEALGYWTLTASIFPENAASLALHHACGFRKVGHRKRIGRMSYGPMKGDWRDTVVLERRSTVVGTD
jgi:L-amino acid N-acyltransferase YncA